MGQKGDKQTAASLDTAKEIIDVLAGIQGVFSKKMFGGVGVFSEKGMFGMVDSKGKIYFKRNQETEKLIASAGAKPHEKMPYVELPEDVLSDNTMLMSLAEICISLL